MMKSRQLFLIISLFVALKVSAGKPVPVLVADYCIDTSLYDLSGAHNNCRIRYAIYEGPLTYESTTGIAFRRKNSDQFDIYSFAGKMATVTVPIVSTQELNGEINILFSRNMLDNDDGWESIVNYSFLIIMLILAFLKSTMMIRQNFQQITESFHMGLMEKILMCQQAHI